MRISMRTASGFAHEPWSRQMSLYAVNVRQYTAEGTLRAFEAELPRLADLGVGMLWFLPIQPIGKEQRKGRLGSYYSIRHYTAVNPEFGTLEDFKRVVDRAHALGMKVLLDWVANHTAWDHPWVRQHPQWYQKDAQGRIHAYTFRATPDSAPEYWTDVVGLDYGARELWPAMTEAMDFWVRETGIDGFRCDVAALVPLEFWTQARKTLQRRKPLFMLAEAHESHLHAAFDMTYDWDLYDQLRSIAQGRAQAPALHAWWARRCAHYQADDYRMIYTANHDSNSWHGSCAELYGSLSAFKAMAVLAALLPGMPLVYSGQEAFFEKRLQFFEKDPIDWKDRPLQTFYRTLLRLHNTHPALAQGAGSEFAFQEVGNDQVVAFSKRAAAARLLRPSSSMQLDVAVNVSDQTQTWRDPHGRIRRLGPWGCWWREA